jgi:hypothetical protein
MISPLLLYVLLSSFLTLLGHYLSKMTLLKLHILYFSVHTFIVLGGDVIFVELRPLTGLFSPPDDMFQYETLM